MAIAYARLQFIQRSNGKNACCKAAYNSRSKVQFEGHDFNPKKIYNWSYKEPCVFHCVLLPEHVDKSFKNIEKLWNAAEASELKKNSQVAIELVLALPDDQCISIEDRIELTKSFVQKNFVDKGLAAQIDIHPPEKKIHLSPQSGEVTNFDQNWHAHILLTTRRFSKDGKSLAEKARDIMPDVKTTKSADNRLFVDGTHWGKPWSKEQNYYFEEKGLSLRVDPTGINSQIHLGPVRLRGRAHGLLEENNLRTELNSEQVKNPNTLLNHITKFKNIFQKEDVTALVEKFVEEKLHLDILNKFWNQEEIVTLIDSKGIATGLFTTQEIIAEEKRCLNFADRIQEKATLKLKNDFGQFISNLSLEQKEAYKNIINGKRLACIGGYAGTGKSHLLVAVKKTFEAEGYIVRAFGPDTATSKVLEEKGFLSAENLHRFLFSLKNHKRTIKPNKEIWIIDEASKIGNRPMTQLLKVADENNIQLIFSGDQSQLKAVERGCMYKVFCEKYGSEDLLEIRRQKRESDQHISKQIATGKVSQAIDEITRKGDIIWDDTRKECIENLVKKWAADKVAFPNDSSIIIAHSQAERKTLNEIVRIYRKEKGEISREEFQCKTDDKKIYVSVGDQIEFSKNDKTLAVTNGMTGVLIEASSDEFVVSVKEGESNRTIIFNPNDYSSFQLGYATTYHRSQGKTVDRAYVLHSPRLNKESFYVGLTRHVHKAYLFVPKDNMHYLSYLKAKACGFTKDYQTFVSGQNPFFHPKQEDYSDQLKDQVGKGELNENTHTYLTDQEAYISTLKNSNSTFSKLKGYGLSAWHKVTDKIKSHNYAKKADYEFYHPVVKQESVTTVSKISLDYLEESYSEIEIDKKIISSLIKNENKLTPVLKDSNKNNENWKKLSDNQREILRSYFEANKTANSFFSIIKAECVDDLKTSVHFKPWMDACLKRNEKAYLVTKNLPKKELENILGMTCLDILWEKSHKHEIELEKLSNRNVNLDSALKENLDSLLFKLFPEGPSRRERNSFRFGAKGSLVVKSTGEKKGSFFDHQNEVGGGPLHLIQRTLNLSPAESRQWAKDFLGQVPAPLAPLKTFKHVEEINTWISEKPCPTIPAPSLDKINKGLSQYYQEVARHAYSNEKGEILFYILRLANKENTTKKSILPLSFGKEKGEEKSYWSLKGYQDYKKPIYNLPEVIKNTKDLILIVEGEKTADAANKLFSKEGVTCITWSGGTSAVSRSDWTHLYGKQVVIWPDNDNAGFQAGEKICSELRKVGVKSLHTVDKEILMKQFPEKWDLADAFPKDKNINYIKDLIFNAKEKSLGIDQLNLGTSCNLKDKLMLNEILWRIEERLRPELEANCLKTLEINNEIQKEFLKVIATEKIINEQLKQSGIRGDLSKVISFQALLHQAATGTSLTKSSIQNMKNILKDVTLQHLNSDNASLFTKENIPKKELEDLLREKFLINIFKSGSKAINIDEKSDIKNLYICALEKDNIHKKSSNQLEY